MINLHFPTFDLSYCRRSQPCRSMDLGIRSSVIQHYLGSCVLEWVGHSSPIIGVTVMPTAKTAITAIGDALNITHMKPSYFTLTLKSWLFTISFLSCSNDCCGLNPLTSGRLL